MTKRLDLGGWFFKLVFKYRNKCNVLFFNWIIHLLARIKGISIGKNVKFNGLPVFRRHPNSTIQFQNNCSFNSSRNSVPIGLLKRCTFVTLKPDAEIVFGNNSGASGVTMVAAQSIRVGDNVKMGVNCTIIDNDFHHSDPDKRESEEFLSSKVIIEDNVFLGFNCMVLKGVTIGENSVIGANSVVIHSIPSNSIAIGNPCKVIIKKNWNASI